MPRYASLLVALLVLASPLTVAAESKIPFEVNRFDKETVHAAEAFGQGKYRDVLIELKYKYDPQSILLKGMASFELKDYRNAAREFSSYVESMRGKLYSDADRDLYKTALWQLMLSYYNSDDLDSSRQALDEYSKLADRDEIDEIMQFRSKLGREIKGNTNSVTESSDHFKVIFDGYEHGSVDRLVLGILEDAYREIGQEFGEFPRNTLTVVLHTNKAFHDVTRSPAWAGGVFMDGKIRLPVGGIEDFDRAEVRRVIFHEYVHALIYSMTPNCPRWLHEGLAEYLSKGPLAVAGTPQLQFKVIDGAFMSPDVRGVVVAYVESYRAVKALLDKYGMYEVKQYIEAMGRGNDPEAAFEDTFYIKYSGFPGNIVN